MPVAALAPYLIMAGGSIGASALGNRMAQPGDVEKGAISAQTGLAQQQAEQSRQLFGLGMPYLQQAGGYYQPLLQGSRAAMSQAVAPEAGGITSVYRGAERGLERSGLQGGDLDLARAEMSRQRAGQISNLIPQARAGAASSLASLGAGALGASQGGAGLAGNLWGNVGQMGMQQRLIQQQGGYGMGQSTGEFLFNILKDKPGRAKTSAKGAAPAPGLW